jgi:carboxynorspermidine decarboxylase
MASVDLPTEGIHFDPDSVATPYTVIDLSLLRKNLALLSSVAERSGARILLAQKGFATWSVYPLCAQYLSGVTEIVGTPSLWKPTRVCDVVVEADMRTVVG